MRVIVCGSRKWKDAEAIRERMQRLSADTVIVHGACPTGADRIADWYATTPRVDGSQAFQVERHPALWKKHGSPEAAHIRNQEMADAGADLCIAFVDKLSGGTWDMVTRARKAGIPVDIVWACGLGDE